MTFEFGVAAGDLTSSGAVLWTRTRPSMTVEWRLTNQGKPIRRGTAKSCENGFVHVRLSELSPGTTWHYQFLLDDESSEWGRFRTLPVEGSTRFAVVSCAKLNSGYFNAYEAIAQDNDLDFVLHLGDYIYEAGQVPRGSQTPGLDIGRSFDPLHDCVTLDDYDRRYAQYRRDPQLRALHAAHGMIFTLDDHEIADNAWAHGADEHFPEDGSWDERLGGALTAWQRWMPTLRNPVDGGHLWSVVDLGELGSLFLCDTRLNRSDPSEPDATRKTILGQTQLNALEAVTARSERPWLVVAIPSKFLSLEAARSDPTADFVLQTLKLSDRQGNPFHDRWDAYSHEQNRLLKAFDEGPARSLLLCGDVHFAAHSQTDSRNVIECLTSSVSSPNFDDKLGWPHGDKSRPYEQRLVDLIPELNWCDLDRHGYMTVDLSVDALTCEWWGVASVTRRSSEVDLLHRIVLPAKRPIARVRE